MNRTIKKGAELIDEFFAEIPSLEGIDPDLAQKLIEIYREKGKLTKTTLDRAIAEIDADSTEDSEGAFE